MSQASDTLIDTIFDGRYRILRKLGLTSNAALVHYAVRHQLVG